MMTCTLKAMTFLFAMTGLGICGSYTCSSSATSEVDDFKPKEFLCDLTGGPFPDRSSGDKYAGRRYTLKERKAARVKISAVLEGFGLKPKEHVYGDKLKHKTHPSKGDRPKQSSIPISWMFVRTGIGKYKPEFLGKAEVMAKPNGVNLYAELPATIDTDRWLVIGAHYDTVSRSPGADDNASGVTAVLLTARKLLNLKARRAVNVLLAFFDQEEVGLIGSQAFALWLKSGETDYNVVGMVNFDMVGWDADFDRLVELSILPAEKGKPDKTGIFQRMATASRLVKMKGPDGVPTRLPAFLNRTTVPYSDHYSFAKVGIPAVMVSQEYVGRDSTPHYHRRTDTCDKIDFDFLEIAATLVAGYVWIIDF